MTKKRKTRTVDKSEYRDFLAKADDFASMLDLALAEGKWNSAGLQAVHAVISASDAVIVYYGGVRSVELDHREVVGLLHDIIGEAAATAGRHVSRVIAKKNLVEYEGRSITHAEAREMAEHAKRFLEWVTGMLPRE
ncbi:MAG: HEPN domain-containing protein [Nitrospirota bacterium]